MNGRAAPAQCPLPVTALMLCDDLDAPIVHYVK